MLETFFPSGLGFSYRRKTSIRDFSVFPDFENTGLEVHFRDLSAFTENTAHQPYPSPSCVVSAQPDTDRELCKYHLQTDSWARQLTDVDQRRLKVRAAELYQNLATLRGIQAAGADTNGLRRQRSVQTLARRVQLHAPDLGSTEPRRSHDPRDSLLAPQVLSASER